MRIANADVSITAIIAVPEYFGQIHRITSSYMKAVRLREPRYEKHYLLCPPDVYIPNEIPL